jgi:predicted Zn finger-like uncharacterized protein
VLVGHTTGIGYMDHLRLLMRCPHCEARYFVVRVEADSTSVDREITCISCGGPFNGREGKFILKYFLASEPRKQAGKRYGGIRSR